MAGGGSTYDPSALGEQLGNKLTTEVNTPAAVFNKPLYAGVSNQTSAGINGLNASANNPAYTAGIGGAISSFGDVAAGKAFGMNDPGYATLRQNVANDTLANVNAAFNANGRFGGGANVESASEGLGNALAGLDYGNYQSDIARHQQAAQMLPGLFSASQLPAQAQLASGQMIDSARQAALLADNDLFRRQNDSDFNKTLQALGAFTGSQNNAGMQQETPWWQTALGYVAGNAGNAMKLF